MGSSFICTCTREHPDEVILALGRCPFDGVPPRQKRPKPLSPDEQMAIGEMQLKLDQARWKAEAEARREAGEWEYGRLKLMCAVAREPYERQLETERAAMLGYAREQRAAQDLVEGFEARQHLKQMAALRAQGDALMARRPPLRDRRGRFVKRPAPPLPSEVLARVGVAFIPVVTHERHVLEVAPPPLVLESVSSLPLRPVQPLLLL